MDISPHYEIGKDNDCPKKVKVSRLLLHDSDDLTEFVSFSDNYKPNDVSLLTELEHDIEEVDFDRNKKPVHSFSCSAELHEVDAALNRIDLNVISNEPSLHDEVQENEPADPCDNINLKFVNVPSSGGVPEGTALNVVGTTDNEGLDSRSTHSSQKDKVKNLHSLVIKSARRQKPRYLSETASVDQKFRRIKRIETKISELTEPIADTELNVVGITDKCFEVLDINHKCTADNKTEGTKELFFGTECNCCEQSQMQDCHTPEPVFSPRVHSGQKGKVKRSHLSRMKSAQRKKCSVVNQEPRELNKTGIEGDECTEDTDPAVGTGK